MLFCAKAITVYCVVYVFLFFCYYAGHIRIYAYKVEHLAAFYWKYMLGHIPPMKGLNEV